MASARALTALFLGLGCRAITLGRDPEAELFQFADFDYDYDDKPTEDDKVCKCVPWSDAFASQADCMRGFGGLRGEEFCEFVRKFDSNLCLGSGFQAPWQMPAGCYTSEGCIRSGKSNHMKHNFRLCKSDDASVQDMNTTALSDLAESLGVDVGILTDFAAVHKELHVSNVTNQVLEQIKGSGKHTYISKRRDHEADRLEVRGNEVWRHRRAKSRRNGWEVTCDSGCK